MTSGTLYTVLVMGSKVLENKVEEGASAYNKEMLLINIFSIPLVKG